MSADFAFSLALMGKGMLGIFVIIGIITLCVLLMGRIFKAKG